MRTGICNVRCRSSRCYILQRALSDYSTGCQVSRKDWEQRHWLPQGILEGSWGWGREFGTCFFKRHWFCLLSVWKTRLRAELRIWVVLLIFLTQLDGLAVHNLSFYLQTAERKLQMGIGCCQTKHLSLPSDKSQMLLAQRQSGAVILAGRRLRDNQKGANKNPLPGDNLSRKERLDLPPPLRWVP